MRSSSRGPSRARICLVLATCLMLLLSAVPAAADHPLHEVSPSTPVQIFPPDGYQGDNQASWWLVNGFRMSFHIGFVDAGDLSTGSEPWGEIELRDSGGALLLTRVANVNGREFALGGGVASAHAYLAPGGYQWRARACQAGSPTRCSAFTGYQIFTVPPNGPPGAPEILAPQANSLFAADERQDFTIRAADPDGEHYWGSINIVNAVTGAPVQNFNTSPAPSGLPSTWSLAANPLEAGTYLMTAGAFDSHNLPTSANDHEMATTTQVFGVASKAVSPCTGSTPLVDGWFGDRYLQLAGATVGGVGYICVRTNQGSPQVAGWLRAEVGGASGGGTPTVGTTAACTDGDGGDDNLPFPLLDQKVGGTSENPTNQLWAMLRRSGSALTACFKVKAAGGNLLDTSVTIEGPDNAELSDLAFVPEQLSPAWTPPAPVAPPAGLPSSECYQAPTGNVLVANADVDGQHLWLYRQADDAGAKVCARIEGSQDKGVVVRQQAGGGEPPYTLTTGRQLDDPAVPCRTDDYIYMSDAPYVARLHTTQPDGDPVGVCAYVGLTANTRVSAWLLMDRTPDTGSVTYGIDP